MSKKTNAEKLRAHGGSRKPRKRAWRPRGKRPNPANVTRDNQSVMDKLPPVLKDPVFLHYVAGAVMRYLEISYPVELQISGELARIDAEFSDDARCVWCEKTRTEAGQSICSVEHGQPAARVQGTP